MTTPRFQPRGAAAAWRQLLLALIGSAAVCAAAGAQLSGGGIGSVAADKTPRSAAASASAAKARPGAAAAAASAGRTAPAR